MIAGIALMAICASIVIGWGFITWPKVDDCGDPQCSPSRKALTSSQYSGWVKRRRKWINRQDYLSQGNRWRALEKHVQKESTRKEAS